jgi:DNA-binding CsgD family transcriptional regulator
VLTAACESVGIDREVLDEVRAAGILDLTDGRLAFAHPLMRSVVYGQAEADPRRTAHRVLAASLRRDSDLDRRAWHLAGAASGPDEGAAAALEHAATAARERGAYAVAGAALARAAELSSAVEDRTRRLVSAGDAFWHGGRTARAKHLFDEALSITADPLERADIRLRTGVAAALVAPLPSWREDVVRTADAVRDIDRDRAGLLMAQASAAALTTGELDAAIVAADDAVELAEGWTSRLASLLVLSLARLAVGDRSGAGEGLDLFVSLIDGVGVREEWFGAAESLANALMWVERFGDARRLLDAMVTYARDLSAPGMLPLALAVRAELSFWTGSWIAAFNDAWDATTLARESEQTALLPYPLVTLGRIEAASGYEREAHEHLADAVTRAHDVGHRSIELWALGGLGFLHLGAGRFGEAVVLLEQLASGAERIGVWHPSSLTWLGDLAEAHARRGCREEATRVAGRLEVLAGRTGGAWATAAALRARGLIADGEARDGPFLRALDLPVLGELPFERARTELSFAEALVDTDRPVDAMPYLWAARDEFARLGAAAWVDRVDDELTRCGEEPGDIDRHGLDRLTPQELQVATAVAAGATNREAAEQLFLSRRTVEHHLGNVYRKLGIHSRMHLVRLMGNAPR